MRRLTTDFSKGDERPYFLWDEDVAIDELRAKLGGNDENERLRLLGLRSYIAGLVRRLRRAAAPGN
ncbi:MAG TPA: hypothetical protein PKA88_14465 [Polyangiaceae bacterium]|nr:hypothetical protein [Polyangiaceae bacterium]HMR77948.1 hypothetical protein [Polyangiaceae bacterium]